MISRFALWLRTLFTGHFPSVIESFENRIPVFADVKARISRIHHIPRCELSQYRTIVKVLPRPSDEQIDNYVQFVCEAHSWYKHLPLLPPGVLFRFFIDPYSGYDRVLRADGRVVRHHERTVTSFAGHYTWMTTSEYGARFGHLDYDTDGGTRFVIPLAGHEHEYAEGPTFSTREMAYRIPAKVATIGSVPLTAIIHPNTAKIRWWQNFLRNEQSRVWPIETGGDRTLVAIETLCKRAARLKGWEVQAIAKINAELMQLLEPENRRLKQEMKKAIRRMIQLVYE